MFEVTECSIHGGIIVESDLENGEIAESKINPARARIVEGIVLWAQDEKDKKWDATFDCHGRSLCERTVITD